MMKGTGKEIQNPQNRNSGPSSAQNSDKEFSDEYTKLYLQYLKSKEENSKSPGKLFDEALRDSLRWISEEKNYFSECFKLPKLSVISENKLSNALVDADSYKKANLSDFILTSSINYFSSVEEKNKGNGDLLIFSLDLSVFSVGIVQFLTTGDGENKVKFFCLSQAGLNDEDKQEAKKCLFGIESQGFKPEVSFFYLSDNFKFERAIKNPFVLFQLTFSSLLCLTELEEKNMKEIVKKISRKKIAEIYREKCHHQMNEFISDHAPVFFMGLSENYKKEIRKIKEIKKVFKKITEKEPFNWGQVKIIDKDEDRYSFINDGDEKEFILFLVEDSRKSIIDFSRLIERIYKWSLEIDQPYKNKILVIGYFSILVIDIKIEEKSYNKTYNIIVFSPEEYSDFSLAEVEYFFKKTRKSNTTDKENNTISDHDIKLYAEKNIITNNEVVAPVLKRLFWKNEKALKRIEEIIKLEKRKNEFYKIITDCFSGCGFSGEFNFREVYNTYSKAGALFDFSTQKDVDSIVNELKTVLETIEVDRLKQRREKYTIVFCSLYLQLSFFFILDFSNHRKKLDFSCFFTGRNFSAKEQEQIKFDKEQEIQIKKALTKIETYFFITLGFETNHYKKNEECASFEDLIKVFSKFLNQKMDNFKKRDLVVSKKERFSMLKELKKKKNFGDQKTLKRKLEASGDRQRPKKLLKLSLKTPELLFFELINLFNKNSDWFLETFDFFVKNNALINASRKAALPLIKRKEGDFLAKEIAQEFLIFSTDRDRAEETFVLPAKLDIFLIKLLRFHKNKENKDLSEVDFLCFSNEEISENKRQIITTCLQMLPECGVFPETSFYGIGDDNKGDLGSAFNTLVALLKLALCALFYSLGDGKYSFEDVKKIDREEVKSFLSNLFKEQFYRDIKKIFLEQDASSPLGAGDRYKISIKNLFDELADRDVFKKSVIFPSNESKKKIRVYKFPLLKNTEEGKKRDVIILEEDPEQFLKYVSGESEILHLTGGIEKEDTLTSKNTKTSILFFCDFFVLMLTLKEEGGLINLIASSQYLEFANFEITNWFPGVFKESDIKLDIKKNAVENEQEMSKFILEQLMGKEEIFPREVKEMFSSKKRETYFLSEINMILDKNYFSRELDDGEIYKNSNNKNFRCLINCSTRPSHILGDVEKALKKIEQDVGGDTKNKYCHIVLSFSVYRDFSFLFVLNNKKMRFYLLSLEKDIEILTSLYSQMDAYLFDVLGLEMEVSKGYQVTVKNYELLAAIKEHLNRIISESYENISSNKSYLSNRNTFFHSQQGKEPQMYLLGLGGGRVCPPF